MARRKSRNGFTLVELVVVIAVIAILGAMSTQFLFSPVLGYTNTEAYTSMADTADTALRRMGRDVRNALPNSVRVDASSRFLEFIPVASAGRYRVASNETGGGDPLDFTLASDSFDVFGPGLTVSATDQLVIYNLGIPGADAYNGDNRRALSAATNSNTLSFSGGTFPLQSPSSRFFVVNRATSYICDLGNRQLLMYAGYSIQAAQPASLGALNGLATPRVLADNVTACSFNYSAGALQRSGIVAVNLELTRNNGVVRLVHFINLVNTP